VSPVATRLPETVTVDPELISVGEIVITGDVSALLDALGADFPTIVSLPNFSPIRKQLLTLTLSDLVL
jgi:hypothetical protein